MYKEFETETSYRYLKEVIENLDEPACIVGGWAVFFHVNHRFEKEKARPYLGSRDIDLGFNIQDKSSISSAIESLKKLNFRPLSFRFFKEIHIEKQKEIKSEETVPSHQIFPMYVDLIVDTIPKGFKQVFGFNPIDEPLLKQVFEKKGYTFVREFGRKLLLPDVNYMVAMKISSIPQRDKEHKKVKDICDLFALCWYSDTALNDINPREIIPEMRMAQCIAAITQEDLEKVAQQLDHTPEEIRRVIDTVCTKKS